MFRRVERLLSRKQDQAGPSHSNILSADPATPTSTRPAPHHDNVQPSQDGLQSVTNDVDCLTSLDSGQQPTGEVPFGLKTVVGLPETENGVDIIAIHGLNGHRDETWTDKSTGLNWLADPTCLSKDIPGVRVLSFGYNSASYFSRGDANIQDFASELLAAIKANRKSITEKQRPIVFLCHSLGGLVFKQVRITRRGTLWNVLIETFRQLLVLTSGIGTMPSSWKMSRA